MSADGPPNGWLLGWDEDRGFSGLKGGGGASADGRGVRLNLDFTFKEFID